MRTAKTAKSGVNVVHMSEKWAKKSGSFSARITERGEIVLHHPAFYATFDSFVEFKDLLPKYLVHDFAESELVLSRFAHGSVVQTPQDMVRIPLREVLARIQDGELLVVTKDEGITEVILPKLPQLNIPVGMKHATIIHTSTVAGRAYHGFVLEARVTEDRRQPKKNYVPTHFRQMLVPNAPVPPKVANG